MSRLSDKLTKISRAVLQPVGFRTSQPVPSKPRMLLIANLAQANIDGLADYVAGADAGLLHVPKSSSAAKTLQKILEAMPDIPWGGRLIESPQKGIEHISKIGFDFVVFPAASTPLAILQDDKVGKVLEVESSLSEGSLRAVNELPIEAVLVAIEQGESYSLTWNHLILFQHFANLLTKPLLISIPPNVTSVEFQTLWEVGVDGVVIEVESGQPDRLKELRQTVDKTNFPSQHKGRKVEPPLPRVSQSVNIVEEE